MKSFVVLLNAGDLRCPEKRIQLILDNWQAICVPARDCSLAYEPRDDWWFARHKEFLPHSVHRSSNYLRFDELWLPVPPRRLRSPEKLLSTLRRPKQETEDTLCHRQPLRGAQNSWPVVEGR